jgi:hypothetical protein
VDLAVLAGLVDRRLEGVVVGRRAVEDGPVLADVDDGAGVSSSSAPNGDAGAGRFAPSIPNRTAVSTVTRSPSAKRRRIPVSLSV